MQYTDKSRQTATHRLIDLLLISFLSLFFELLVIRWLSSEVRIFAYFKNIPLIACLFGLGLGMALSGSKRNLFQWFPHSLCVIVAILCLAEPLHLVHITFLNPFESYVIGEHQQATFQAAGILTKLLMLLSGPIVLLSVFYLLVAAFCCLGQRLGQALDAFQPLTAYSINVGASLLGILGFSLLAALSCPPLSWLAVGIILCLWFFRRPDQIVVLAGCLLLTLATAKPNVLWSPYYRISISENIGAADGKYPPAKYGYDIRVNYDTIEGAYNNHPQFLASLSPRQRAQTLDYYDTPYIALGKKFKSVLILAAGTGNDVAAALRHGVTDIDAVEIDPAIAKLGRQLHPEAPYSHPGVHVIVDDARAFLKRTKKRYDLIIFSYLDSHSAFSSMSSIRLDNYVYTEESFRDAYRLLQPQGAMSVTFFYLTHWQLARVIKTLESAVGYMPAAVYSAHKNGPCLLVGPGVDLQEVSASGLPPFDRQILSAGLEQEQLSWEKVVTTSDDWPFLFLRERGWSWTYAAGLLFPLLLGWRLVRICFGPQSTDPLGKVMFCLGAAFMLIECKSITQMGLLLGTTWLVNSAVIACVLLMILLSTLLQIRCKFINASWAYVLLTISLLANYLLPISTFNSLPYELRALAGGIFLGLPIVFSGIIFAISFARVEKPHKGLAMNILGALVGGALEYLSLMIGINALNLVALALYGSAYYFWRKDNSSTSNSEASQAAD